MNCDKNNFKLKTWRTHEWRIPPVKSGDADIVRFQQSVFPTCSESLTDSEIETIHGTYVFTKHTNFFMNSECEFHWMWKEIQFLRNDAESVYSGGAVVMRNWPPNHCKTVTLWHTCNWNWWGTFDLLLMKAWHTISSIVLLVVSKFSEFSKHFDSEKWALPYVRIVPLGATRRGM